MGSIWESSVTVMINATLNRFYLTLIEYREIPFARGTKMRVPPSKGAKVFLI